MIEIVLIVIAGCLMYLVFRKEHAFDVDETCWFKVRDKILKENYAGVTYSMMSSNSPVIIKHRGPLPLDKRHSIQKFFPGYIRIEFQEVTYEGEITRLYGKGELFPEELINLLRWILLDELTQRQSREYVKNIKDEWIKK